MTDLERATLIRERLKALRVDNSVDELSRIFDLPASVIRTVIGEPMPMPAPPPKLVFFRAFEKAVVILGWRRSGLLGR